MMKKAAALILLVFLAGGTSLLAQEAETAPPPESQPVLSPAPSFTYSSGGRRDPFKDLLGGRDVRERSADGTPLVNIEDLTLIGIIQSRASFTAILGTGRGFPYFSNVGDKFTDGYILKITDNTVVFRKTHERGLPLLRSRDITKEINPEER